MIRSDGPWCLRCARPLCVDGTCGTCDCALALAHENARGLCDAAIDLRDMLARLRSTSHNLEASPW